MYVYNKLNTLELNSGPIYKNSMTSNYIPQCSPEILPSTACTSYAPIFPATQNPNEPNPYAILIRTLCCRRLWTKCFSDQINGSYVCAMEVRKQMKSPNDCTLHQSWTSSLNQRLAADESSSSMMPERGTNKAFHNLIATAADNVKYQICSSKLWNSRSSLEHICNCSSHGNHSDVYIPGTTLKLNRQYQS
jgi:hypothetical protein